MQNKETFRALLLLSNKWDKDMLINRTSMVMRNIHSFMTHDSCSLKCETGENIIHIEFYLNITKHIRYGNP